MAPTATRTGEDIRQRAQRHIQDWPQLGIEHVAEAERRASEWDLFARNLRSTD